jgi:putrescine transport system permease protein
MRRGQFQKLFQNLLQPLVLGFGFAFLYVPIALVVLFSFNASRLVTVWGGFSTRWYGELLSNRQLIESAQTSLAVALTSAALATIIGTCAAVALARYGNFRSRLFLAAGIYAPLVMPEVIIGLALLMTFVSLGLERGFWTIVIAHATLGLCYVAVIVRARFADLDPTLEEAAMDLGAGPMTTFFRVTLPLIAPSVAAGFLLAATISLDDLIIASFTSGPGSTTLPMRIYSAVRLGVTPQINAISTLMIGFVGIILIMFAMARAHANRTGASIR